jgi:hypothetical protein
VHLVERGHAIKAGDLRSLGIVGSELGAGPLFLRAVVCRKKKNFGVGVGRMVLAGLFGGCYYYGRARLAPAGEIKEIVVLAEAVQVVRSLALNRREEHDNAILHRLRKRNAAGAVVGSGLAIESGKQRGESENTSGKEGQPAGRAHRHNLASINRNRRRCPTLMKRAAREQLSCLSIHRFRSDADGERLDMFFLVAAYHAAEEVEAALQ